MAKEFFKDLPNTTTPLTSSRLNGLLDGEEAMGNIVVDSIKSKNMFDIETAIKGYQLAVDGTISTRTNYIVSNYIEVDANTDYYLSNVSGSEQVRTCACYDSNKTFISIQNIAGGNTASGKITTPNNTKYIRVCSYSNNTNIQVEKGTTATTYSPYQELDIDNLANKELVVGGIRSKNLFNYRITPTLQNGVNVNEITNGIKIIATTSNTFLQAIYKILDIDDYLGKTITLSCNINISSGNPRIAIGTCDSSGVNRAILNSKNIGSSGTYSVTATLPTSTTSTTKYIYIGLNISRDVAISVGDYSEFTNILLEENSIATNYVPYQDLGYVGGSNSNGNYIKYNDGTLIQWGTISKNNFQPSSDLKTTVQGINIYRSNNSNIIFPISYIDENYTVSLSAHCYTEGTRMIIPRTFRSTSAGFEAQLTSLEPFYNNGTAYSNLRDLTWYSIGKWK